MSNVNEVSSSSEMPEMLAPDTQRRPRGLRPSRRTIEFALTLVLLVAGVLVAGLANNGQNTVNSQLAAQGLEFPAAGSPYFSPQVFPTVQGYAGQFVTTGARAQAYANGYLGPEINFITGGLTPGAFAQTALADPANATLQAQATEVFQASTTRGILLSSWALSRISTYALYGGLALIAGAIIMLVLFMFDIAGEVRSVRRSRSSAVVRVRPSGRFVPTA